MLHLSTKRVESVGMKLTEYLEQMGDDEKAAQLFQSKKRTVMSWRLGERRPNIKQAKIIAERSPVKVADIYPELLA